jgi:uncharacterized membrane protein YdjX (TVP38/TMEM64 family)
LNAIVLLRRFGPLLLIAALVAAAVFSGATRRLSLGELEAHRLMLRGFVATHLWLSLAAFVLAYVVVAATALPGPLILTISGGLLFGPVVGPLVVLVGATLGSDVLFLAARSAFGDLIRRRFGARMAKVEAMLSGRMFESLLIMRLLPVFPLGVITIAAALMRAPLGVFTVASALGMVPSTVIYTSIGASFNRVLDQGGRLSPKLLADPQIVLPLAGLALLAAAPMAYRRWRASRAPKTL